MLQKPPISCGYGTAKGLMLDEVAYIGGHNGETRDT
jgi:hypothetical protein